MSSTETSSRPVRQKVDLTKFAWLSIAAAIVTIAR